MHRALAASAPPETTAPPGRRSGVGPRRAPVAALLAILVVAIAVLLPHLDDQSLWLDEALTLGPALSASSMDDLVIRVRAVDTQPPASHAVLYALRGVLPQTDFFVRLPSFVAIQTGLVLLYLTIGSLWGWRTAVVTVAIAEVSPFLAFYGAEARNYGMWFASACGSFLVLARWYEAIAHRRRGAALGWAVVWGIVLAAASWLHLFSVFLLIGEGAVVVALLLWDRRLAGGRGLAAGTAALAAGIAVGLFVPWLVVLATQGPVDVGWRREFGWTSLAYYLFAAHFGVSLGPPLDEAHVLGMRAMLGRYPVALAAGFGAMSVTLALYAALVGDAIRDARDRWQLLPLVVFPGVALAGPIAYAAVEHFPLHPRHLTFLWPLLPVTLALGWRRGGWARAGAAAVVAVQLVALGNLLFDERYAKEDQRGAIRYAEAHSDGPAFVLADGELARFYTRRAAGVPKEFIDFPPGTHHVWYLDTRPWEDASERSRRKFEAVMARFGYEHRDDTPFHGVTLRHWGPPAS